MQNSYATLAALRRYLGLSASQTGDDALLAALLEAAARLIEAYTGRRFYPARQTRLYTVGQADMLLLDGDLLALEAVVNGDGSTIPLGAIHLQPAAGPVKTSIMIDCAQAVFNHTGDPVDAIQVMGTWGFHPDWDAAWAASGDAVGDAPLSASATTITVTDADALDALGNGPRFAVGHLLRIGTEYAQVVGVDTAANTLAVVREVNGTGAAEHTQGSAIDCYHPPADIVQACVRVAAWLYKQKDSGFVQHTGGLRGQIAVPPALPPDVEQILVPYVRVRMA